MFVCFIFEVQLLICCVFCYFFPVVCDFFGEKMVFPQKNGFSVIYNQILPSVNFDKKEALIKAAAFWGNLSQVEQDRRDKVAKEIWLKSNEAKKATKGLTDDDDEEQPAKKAPKLSE